MNPGPRCARVGELLALPPRVRPALPAGHHELVGGNALGPVIVAGQAPFAVPGVVGRAVVLRGVSAERVGRQQAGQPPEAVLVGRVDQRHPRPAERRAEQGPVPRPPAEQERRRPVGVLGVRAAVVGVRLGHRARQVVQVVGRDRRIQRLVRRREQARILRPGPAGLAGVADLKRQPAVGPQAHQRLVVVDRPVAVGVDVVGLHHDPAGPGAVLRDQVRGVLDARLGLAGPSVAKLALTKLRSPVFSR